MFIDGRTVADDSRIRADLCIIGCGAAGITIARDFLDSRVDVVVLESGGKEVDDDAQALNAGAPGGIDLTSPRARGFGGTTALWGGQCRPLDAIDFTARPWVPFSGWPVGERVLAPYYERATRTVSLGAPAHYWDDDWVGRFTPGLLFAPFRSESAQFEGRPFLYVPTDKLSFSELHEKELAASPSTRIFLHSTVVDFVTGENGGTVESVQARTLTGKAFSVHAKAFIVAAGGFENARLLLNAHRHRPGTIGFDNDRIGRFLMFHPAVKLGTLAISGDSACVAREARGTDEGYVFFKPKDTVQKQKELLNIGVIVTRRFTEMENAIQALRHWLAGRRPDMDVGTALLDMSKNISELARFGYCQLAGSRKKPEAMDVTAWLEQAPAPENRVELSDESDPLGQKRIKVTWSLGDIGRHTLEQVARIFGADAARLGIGRIRVDDDILGGVNDVSLDRTPSFACHQMGTTRMAASPRQGVVDADCRVFGTSNLYVAGSSVFPTVGFATPTLTIIALAHRLSDHLKTAM